MKDLDKILTDALEYARPFLKEGKVASYIPELAKVDPELLGICLINGGEEYRCGDALVPFSMQSVAKVFNLILALETVGADVLFQRVGMSPSEEPFNCLPKAAEGRCVPANPMLNAGCFVTLDAIQNDDPWPQYLERIRVLCGNQQIEMSDTVYRSEKSCSQRNREILSVLEQNQALTHAPEQILDLHIRSSSLLVTACDLARFSAVLANGGRAPDTREQLIAPDIVKTVCTMMFLCGMYNAAGQYAQRVGMPSKSGVGGGIIAAGRGIGVAVFGPALDTFGNSVGGQKMLEYCSDKLGLHLFA